MPAEVTRFPDPRHARGDIIAIGEDLSADTLRDAYRHGIFPWPHDELPLPWFSPRRRALLFFDELHVGRSLRRRAKQSPFRFTIDAAFDRVIEACASVERDDQGTWIGPDIIRAYTRLHREGDAHSVEVWDGDDLVGGLYGVDAGGAFTGESMFHLRSDASKLALLYLIEHLRARGSSWLDCQIITPHMRALGAREVTRPEFLDLLEEAQRGGRDLFGERPSRPQ
ncbi:MAG TPA: leucyl/phenylalanyl-tRNA--protein transferase [Thermoanaerobaculia bacterium]|nr:leucyl/phenylalanyl-tRNA--protein transferase [Thermoanaerobaculia bacterium]